MARYLILLLLLGCLAGKQMTQDTFATIHPGMSLAQVEAIAGKPWEINPLPRDQMEAVYCERISLRDRSGEERRYVLRFHEGRLLSKHTQISRKEVGQKLQWEF
jgi:hypothetical protein